MAKEEIKLEILDVDIIKLQEVIKQLKSKKKVYLQLNYYNAIKEAMIK